MINYDEAEDILTVRFGSTRGTLGRDLDPYCVLFYSDKTLQQAIIFGYQGLKEDNSPLIQQYESIIGIALP